MVASTSVPRQVDNDMVVLPSKDYPGTPDSWLLELFSKYIDGLFIWKIHVHYVEA